MKVTDLWLLTDPVSWIFVINVFPYQNECDVESVSMWISFIEWYAYFLPLLIL